MSYPPDYDGDTVDDAEATYMAGYTEGMTVGREAIALLADLVVKCTEYGSQDSGFVANYLLPTGPIHRAIPYLEQRGIVVRPGFDGRKRSDEPAAHPGPLPVTPARVLAVLEVLGWPDDREQSVHDGVTRPREYWDLVEDVVRAADAA